MAENVPFFCWSDEMSVNSCIIDDQHKQLVDILNEIYEAFLNNVHRDKVGSIIAKMAEYALDHFFTEERYFAYIDPEEKCKHLKEHHEFKLKVLEFAEQHRSESRTVSYDVLTYLRDWLYNHIMSSDMKIAEHFPKDIVSQQHAEA